MIIRYQGNNSIKIAIPLLYCNIFHIKKGKQYEVVPILDGFGTSKNSAPIPRKLRSAGCLQQPQDHNKEYDEHHQNNAPFQAFFSQEDDFHNNTSLHKWYAGRCRVRQDIQNRDNSSRNLPFLFSQYFLRISSRMFFAFRISSFCPGPEISLSMVRAP